ncbi:MAG: 16S rRNA (cytosine(1402)-N(4))-methyltransferase RsmH [Tissierellia bacterium]|nr:16S rRNA (cytosine(1402)-N(4))-methyltransferase RsmH [Tissierellia bacterium]
MYHRPIMVNEVLSGLSIDPNGVYVDATLGGGGHSEAVAQLLENGKLISIDQDQDAINEAKKRLDKYGNVIIVKDNFENLDKVLKNLNIEKVNGILMDIGVSSHQLDEGDRGFSYNLDAPLDMRMNKEAEISAWNIVNEYSEEALEKIILDFGEERWGKRIAAFIVEARISNHINTTFELSEVIKKAIPKQVRMGMKHPAKKVFQAIRIEVNRELEVLDIALDKALNALLPGGRLAVLTFHSLEDRIVKERFRHWQSDCICPPTSPICQCDKEKEAIIVNRKPITASDEELETNPRAASAKLRIIERC